MDDPQRTAYQKVREPADSQLTVRKHWPTICHLVACSFTDSVCDNQVLSIQEKISARKRAVSLCHSVGVLNIFV